jgi:hypothetical protein
VYSCVRVLVPISQLPPPPLSYAYTLINWTELSRTEFSYDDYDDGGDDNDDRKIATAEHTPIQTIMWVSKMETSVSSCCTEILEYQSRYLRCRHHDSNKMCHWHNGSHPMCHWHNDSYQKCHRHDASDKALKTESGGF